MITRPRYLRCLDNARDAIARGSLGWAHAWIAWARKYHAEEVRACPAELRPQYRRCADGRWAPVLALGPQGSVLAVGRARYAHRQSAQRRAARMLAEATP